MVAARAVVALVLLVGRVPGAAAQAAADTAAVVWANTRSGVYHCASSEAYGQTAAGAYLPEADARARGFRPRGGRGCGAAERAGVMEVAGDSTALRIARVLATDPPDASPPRPSGMTPCAVTAITDGDTIVCRGGLRVRLIGIDAPERAQGRFGDAATKGLVALLPRGAAVQLERDVETTDRYGRRLAYVWYGGQLINWRMVRQGWAVSYPYGRTQRYTAVLDAAEGRASAERRGLWGVGGFECRPARYRRGGC